MAKKPAQKQAEEGQSDHLNALIPRELKRRLLIARANTGRPMSALLIDFIEKGLADLEKQLGKAK